MTSTALFSFAPSGGRMECSAFSAPFKFLATALVTAAVAWGWHMWTNGLIETTLASSGWLFAALCMMIYTEWYIVTGKTKLSSEALEQAWVWNKRTKLNELAFVKLIRVRGFEWLIAPRLYTKTFSNKLAVFYAADKAMLAEFERLERELKLVRNRYQSQPQ